MAWADSTARPLAIAPLSATGPSNHSRISWTSANGVFAPGMAAGTGGERDQAVRTLLDRLSCEELLMMSCSTTPPQPCTAALTSSRAPSEVITIGTLYFAHSSMSCSSRLLLLWTI